MRTVVAWRRYACKDNGEEYQSEIDCSFIGTTQFQWSVFTETEPTQFRKEIKEVVYHLHPTFPNKDVVKTNESEGFILNAQGWGEFTITVELVLYDNRRLVSS